MFAQIIHFYRLSFLLQGMVTIYEHVMYFRGWFAIRWGKGVGGGEGREMNYKGFIKTFLSEEIDLFAVWKNY